MSLVRTTSALLVSGLLLATAAWSQGASQTALEHSAGGGDGAADQQITALQSQLTRAFLNSDTAFL